MRSPGDNMRASDARHRIKRRGLPSMAAAFRKLGNGAKRATAAMVNLALAIPEPDRFRR
jgi:CO/xanthine dehydrogenase Mo-binding subunit